MVVQAPMVSQHSTMLLTRLAVMGGLNAIGSPRGIHTKVYMLIYGPDFLGHAENSRERQQ